MRHLKFARPTPKLLWCYAPGGKICNFLCFFNKSGLTCDEAFPDKEYVFGAMKCYIHILSNKASSTSLKTLASRRYFTQEIFIDNDKPHLLCVVGHDAREKRLLLQV